MDTLKKLKLIGILAISLGAIAALLCLFPKGIILAMPIGFFGMICSSIYIYIDTKNEINSNSFTLGILGIILSSVPVLLILAFTIINHFNQ